MTQCVGDLPFGGAQNAAIEAEIQHGHDEHVHIRVPTDITHIDGDAIERH